MLWGVQMSASADHALYPAHAHLNLLGWVSFALFGLYYHVQQKAAESVLSTVHFWMATAGLVLMIPGIVLALREIDETLVKLGSLLTVGAMLLFVFIIFRYRIRTAEMPSVSTISSRKV
ncbi:MAG: cbb3-type cytochrome oxidase subunit 1 [Sneathiella sp.]|jgi:cbb3-type cytochrome oxidase subunit 1